MLLFRNTLPDLKSNVRFIHAVPGAPNVDIYANGVLLYSDLGFGKVTEYISIAPGKYTLQLFKSKSPNTDNAIISQTIEILPNSTITSSVILKDNKVSVFNINDVMDKSNPFLSYVRFINLSPNSTGLSLSLPNGPILFNEEPYLAINEYYPLSPGVYNFIVSSSKNNFKKFINTIDLKTNVFITIYIIGMMNDSPKTGYILIKDGLSQKRD